MSEPQTAAEGDRERFEEIRAHYDEYGFDGPTELDHERNGIIGFLLDAYDRLNVENTHLRDTDRDRNVELDRLTAECDRLGAAGTEIGESWRRRAEAIEAERDGDVWAAARAIDLIEALWSGGASHAEAEDVLGELETRYGPRIAELDAREAKAGGSDA